MTRSLRQECIARTRRAAFAGLAGLALAGLAPLACGGEQKPAETPPPTTATAAPTAPPPPASGAATTAAPDAGGATAAADAGATPAPLSQIVTTDPSVLDAYLKQLQSAPAATPQAKVDAGDPIAAGLKGLAAKHAKGMQPDGQMATGDLKEGDHLSMMVTLQAGKCYSLIGFSPKGGIVDLDLRLLAPPFFNMISGEDTTDDNSPIVGRDPNPMCPVVPMPLAYKVDIHAQKGSGRAGVQLFSRAAK